MGWNLGSRFTIGHSGLVGQCAASFLDMWSHCCAEKKQQSEQCQCLQVRAEKVQVLGLLRDDQLMNLAAWLQTNKAARGYRAALLWCTYNNIALWRSPERTGKCHLCASEWGGGEGGVGPRMCLYSPNNSPCWGLVREGWKGLMWYLKGAVVHLHASPLVNKVWKSAERGSLPQELLQVECGTWGVNCSWEEQEKMDVCEKHGSCLANVWIKWNENQ